MRVAFGNGEAEKLAPCAGHHAQKDNRRGEQERPQQVFRLGHAKGDDNDQQGRQEYRCQCCGKAFRHREFLRRPTIPGPWQAGSCRDSLCSWEEHGVGDGFVGTGAAFVGVAALAAARQAVPVLAKLSPQPAIRLTVPNLQETLLAEVAQRELLMRVEAAGADRAVPVDRGMIPEMFARVTLAANTCALVLEMVLIP
jgi:hypothetical protein